MKNISRYIVVALGIVAMLTSCDVTTFTPCGSLDYPYRYSATDGVPTVSYVRYAAQDVYITQAYMSEEICIVGDNLRSVHDVLFNDQPAVLNTALITDHTLLVSVPKTLSKNPTDKIYLITKDEKTVEYSFKVLPPVPTVSAMGCEYTPAGSKTTISGSYFTYPLTVEFTGCDPFTVEEGSNTMECFECTVPAGALAGRVKVTTTSGTGVSSFQYLDDRGMLFDFDGKTGLGASHGWHAREVKSDETSICGNFVQLGDGSSVLSNWNDAQYAFEYWAGSWDDPQNITSGDGIALYNLVDFTGFAGMAIKFEMMIPADTPWRDYPMQICFEGFDKVSISGNPIDGYKSVASANAYAFNNEDGTSGYFSRAWYMPWQETGEFTTDGKWITVTIPFSEFSYDKDGNEATSYLSSYKDFASLTIFCMGPQVEDASSTPIIKIDNIRAVAL